MQRFKFRLSAKLGAPAGCRSRPILPTGPFSQTSSRPQLPRQFWTPLLRIRQCDFIARSRLSSLLVLKLRWRCGMGPAEVALLHSLHLAHFFREGRFVFLVFAAVCLELVSHVVGLFVFPILPGIL